MRSDLLFASLLIAAIFSCGTVYCKESKNLVPTLPPPTAEWPVFPPADTTKPDKPAEEKEAKPEPEKSSAEGSNSSSDSPVIEPSASSPLVSPEAVAPSAVVPASSAQLEPHKRPEPAGYAAAAALFKQRKFPQAQKSFESIIKTGAADVNTHLCLAHCFLQQRQYSKAIKEFDWLGEHAKNSISLKNSCAGSARSLRSYMSGICPGQCIKYNDPRFKVMGGKRWISFRTPGGGAMLLTDGHCGDVVVYEKGNPVDKGKCTICGGSTQVERLKDGDPMPRI